MSSKLKLWLGHRLRVINQDHGFKLHPHHQMEQSKRADMMVLDGNHATNTVCLHDIQVLIQGLIWTSPTGPVVSNLSSVRPSPSSGAVNLHH